MCIRDRKGKAQAPGLVDQPSDYQISVPVHRRNPRLARVQLAGLHPRVGVVLSFQLICSIQTPTRQRLILTRSPINLGFFPLLWWRGVVTPSTNTPILYCMLYLSNCVVIITVPQSRGREMFPSLGHRLHLYRSSCNVPCISPTLLPRLALSYYNTIL